MINSPVVPPNRQINGGRPEEGFRPNMPFATKHQNIGYFLCMALFKPKYKRLVDKIYVVHKGTNEVTLNNMDKLTYFSINYPEKVNKVAIYFHDKIMKQMKKRKYNHIDVSLQALDALLSSMPTQSYNLYAEHFLVVASQLLATQDQRLQNMATRSMEKFALLKEESPLYHGCYEILIHQYSTLCKMQDISTRYIGVRGLHAIVRKIALEELAENIWRPIHMNKIVSGLLTCMSEYSMSPSGIEMLIDVCGLEAEKCITALMSTASFGQVTSVLNSVYSFLDEKNLWGERMFTNYVYKLIMSSIQSRYWHAIVINAISHLEQQSSAPVTTRRNELKVLCTMLELIKSRALGPLMFDYLVFLFEETSRISAAKEADPQELLYAQDLMNCLESASSHLAEFESLEVMVFITEKILDPKKEVSVDIMFRCLYTVALSYKNRFPIPMYKPLFYLMSDISTTEMGQIIFHTLLDVHGNLVTVDLPTYDVRLRNKPYCRGNMFLVRTYDKEIYAAILKSLAASQIIKSTHVKTVHRTLLTIGAYQDPVTILNFIACMFLLQELVLTKLMGPSERAKLLIASLGLFIASAEITGLSRLAEYGKELIVHRGIHAPEMTVNAAALKFGSHFSSCCLLEENSINCRLEGNGSVSTNTIGPVIEELREKLKATIRIEGESLVIGSDLLSSFYEDSLPVMGVVPEELSVGAMKMILATPPEESRKIRAIKMQEARNMYATCTLEDIARSLENQEDEKNRAVVRGINSSSGNETKESQTLFAKLDERFPDLFY